MLEMMFQALNCFFNDFSPSISGFKIVQFLGYKKSSLFFLVVYNKYIIHTIVLQIDRLINLLSSDDIVLTGMRFFSITRKFMLAVRMNQDSMENSSVFHNTKLFLVKKIIL